MGPTLFRTSLPKDEDAPDSFSNQETQPLQTPRRNPLKLASLLFRSNSTLFVVVVFGFLLCMHGMLRFTIGRGAMNASLSCVGTTAQSPMVFKFDPSPKTRPLKSKAVVTIYSATAVVDRSYEYDTQFADTLTLVYSLLHGNGTRIEEEEEVEVVVAFTGELVESKRVSLLSLGARLVRIQDLPAVNTTDTHKPCLSCFAKIVLFGLEGTFTDVLYLASNMLLSEPITSIFTHATTAHFFGAIESPVTPTEFDTSVLLFKPSLARFYRLFAKYSQPTHIQTTYFTDQALLNAFFSSSSQQPTCQQWTRLPSRYNTQHPTLQSHTTLSTSIATQHDFWSTPSNRGPCALIYTHWQETLLALFHHQHSISNKSDVSIPPSSFDDLQAVLQANTFTSKIVLYTLLTVKNRTDPLPARILANRERYVARYPFLDHFFQDKKSTKHGKAVWQKAYDAKRLLSQEGGYDWMWLLDASDAFIMNAEVDLRVLIGRLVVESRHEVDVLIAEDFNRMNAGSFFLRASAWTRDRFMGQWLEREEKWNEQDAIIDMWKEDVVETKKHLMKVEQGRQNLFNAYAFGPEPRFKKGDFVLHAPSLGFEMLVKQMGEMNVTEVRRRGAESNDGFQQWLDAFMVENGVHEV
ncbi:hypothetical protein HDU98_002780 [Podochytrium sp. JEL0797]|nr:hypothetical protein HDU98_002780 [Podochytrium sp. JEL0797]